MLLYLTLYLVRMSRSGLIQLLALRVVALSSALDHPVRQDIVDRVNNDKTIGWEVRWSEFCSPDPARVCCARASLSTVSVR